MSSFRLDVGNKFFAVTLVKHWNRLLRAVDASSLEVLEARLDSLVKSVPEHASRVRTR